MSDGDDEDRGTDPERLPPRAYPIEAAYDRRVSLALSSAEWIGRWAVIAAKHDPQAVKVQLATAWVRAVKPTSEFAASLRRLQRLNVKDEQFNLLLASPLIENGLIQLRWCNAVISSLTRTLGGEADFVSFMIGTFERQ